MTTFTETQKQAIDDQGKDILVSASAGSGKTTVLVQRVLKEVLSGTNIDELLIVTFTKTAAEEMKQKIKHELAQALNKNNKRNNFLRDQLNRVDTANISTIDAFCLDVIRRFYYVINLDPNFSILTDETQTALLKERALKETEAKYLEEKDNKFVSFYDNFSGDRNVDSAQNLLLDLYNDAMAKPNYSSWLRKLPNNYDVKGSITDTKLWKKQICPYLLSNFTDLKNKISVLLANPIIDTKELTKVKEAFSYFEKYLIIFLTALKENHDYDNLRSILHNCIFTHFSKSNKWDEDLLEFYEECYDLKNEANKIVFESFISFFAVDQTEQIKIMQQGKTIMQTIVEAELNLINNFNSLKREENLIDYNDMEQLAYQILSQDTSNSQLARSFYKNKFKEIFVDEYQDINSLQEHLIQLIKKADKNTIFMVGDVKQSIYGFRQAEPSLFLKKYHDFGKSDDKHTERIILSENFRSTKSITKLVNHLFNPILSDNFGGINYKKEAQLVFGAQYYPEHLGQASEVIFHEKDKKEDDNNQIDFSEIQMVIRRIQQFKVENLQIYDSHNNEKRPFRYSDIVILTRSRSDNLDIMQQFAKNNIPLFISDVQNYFQTFELTIIMDFLKIIDNPDQDIPLVAVLRSPLYNFSEKDLAKIRINNKRNGFYSALTSYVSLDDELSQRIKEFLNELAEIRDFAVNHRISELIWSIYERTSLLEIMTALPNGEQRRINLEDLYERANSYESAGFKGLYQFINFIDRMRRAKKDLAQPLLTKEAGDSVKLMTIHGSKGLEFPIVFYVGLHHRYQMRDLTNNYVITHNSVGLTIKEPKYRIDSLVKSIDNIQKKRQLLEEEVRILYVALTRAKQKLIIVADIDNFDKKIKLWQRQLNGHNTLSLFDKMSANSALSFIGPFLNFGNHLSQKIDSINAVADQSQSLIYVKYDIDAVNDKTKEPRIKKDNQNYSLLTSTTNKLFDFEYPFKDASKTTAYQAVSEIKAAFNDPINKELDNSHLLTSANRYLQPIDTKPNFLFDTQFSGAEIGTATHLILQYYNYSGTNDKNKLDQEILTLVKQKKLNPEIVSSLKKDEIQWFVHSDFAKKFWQNPDNLKREVDFSSLITATTLFKDFSDSAAKILVHGTIDGYYLDNDGIILFDYKTDYVDKSHLKAAINNIKVKYTGQLRLYEQALNELSKQKVISKYLILLNAKKVVKVK